MPEKILVTVDNIDCGLATLLLRNGEEETPLGVFPLSSLPTGTVAGDILSISFQKEQKETEDAKKMISDVLAKLKAKNKN